MYWGFTLCGSFCGFRDLPQPSVSRLVALFEINLESDLSLILAKLPKSSRKPKGDGHLRRAEILLAAERIFVAEGYEGATIRKIADEVGLSSTALYMHFRDKAEILLEICAEAIQHLLDSNTAIAQMPTDPVVRVRAMLAAYMDFALKNPNAYQLLFGATPGEITEDRAEENMALGERNYDCFRSVVAEIAACGRLRTGSVDGAAQTLWAACHGLVALLIVRPSFIWEPADSLIEGMLDGILYGLVTD